MPRASRVLAKPARLARNAVSTIEDRLDELEGRSSFDGDQMDTIWSVVFPEGAPPPLPDGRRILTARAQDAIASILDAARANPDFSCSRDDWLILTRTILPESYAEPAYPLSPTKALPGTRAKEEVLANRLVMQLCLWHKGDPCDGVKQCEHAVCPAMRRQRKPPPCKPPRDPSLPSRDEIADCKRGQTRLWMHPGMIRLEDALDEPEKEQYDSGRYSHSTREPARYHAS